jgi:molybdate transport system permease protein
MAYDLSPLWISLKVAVFATVITFCLGIVTAYWMLGYRGRWKSLIEGILIAPLILPPTVVGFLLLLLFGKNGPIGRLTAQWDFSIIFSWYGAVLTAIVVSFPLMYRTTLGAFEQVDSSLLQVAQTLGALRNEIFWRVVLPLSVPGVLAGATLAFARSLGEFGATLMLAGNIPGQTQTIPMAIYFAVEAGAMQEAWLWVGIILTISLSSIMATNGWQRQYENRIHGKNLGSGSAQRNGDRSPLAVTLINSDPAQDSEDQPVDQTMPGQGLLVNIERQLPNFNLTVTLTAQSETVGLLGASGSGKSMTLRCIAGVETPSQGQIILNGRILFDSKLGINVPSQRRKIGLVFQNYALFPHLTIRQNIAFGLQALPLKSRRHRIEQQLAMLHLEKFGDRYPHQLSGGQQQRAALARALAIEPDILLLDEPFSALDPHLRYELEKQLIQTLSTYQGLTLFVSHNLEEAYRVCQKLLVLDQGNVVAAGDKQALFNRPGSLTVAQLTGCKNYSRIQAIAGDRIEALDWNCTLQTTELVASSHRHVGIRAHHITFPEVPTQPNTLSAWLAWTSETPYRMTVYLKLGEPPTHRDDYHLQAEVFKETWEPLKDRPMPWLINLAPSRLLLL